MNKADGMEASRAAVLFLELIKRHLFQFDRELFNVKIGKITEYVNQEGITPQERNTLLSKIESNAGEYAGEVRNENKPVSLKRITSHLEVISNSI